ncbi:hypothetical protein AS9A_P10005 (plasmid) [Hoyosella subflava DQS3-9A1]|uniref:Uncharacterized protein n=1 Tax=Hoyosella subflava (strain DSM 45089 / JCM 17490 / NBRC 109087 / DQS3-9A1) TaxID=443218 RepID=F6ESA1_HOYSD|nr:hypothetical protein AS9A_P10005 [Hoyosella subflava DQS3-9A1]
MSRAEPPPGIRNDPGTGHLLAPSAHRKTLLARRRARYATVSGAELRNRDSSWDGRVRPSQLLGTVFIDDCLN